MARTDSDFTAFAARRWPHLVRTAVMLGLSSHDANDLAQTALVRCYASWSKVSNADNPDAYSHTVLLRCHAANLRRRWRGEISSAELPEPATADEAEQAVLRSDLMVALSQLDPAVRAVIVARYLLDLTEKQTAAALQIPLGTVKSRHRRGLDELVPLLSESEPQVTSGSHR